MARGAWLAKASARTAHEGVGLGDRVVVVVVVVEGAGAAGSSSLARASREERMTGLPDMATTAALAWSSEVEQVLEVKHGVWRGNNKKER